MTWTFDEVAAASGAPAAGAAWDGQRLLFTRPGEDTILAYDPATRELSCFRRFTGGIHGLAVSGGGELYGCQTLSRRVVELHKDGSMTALPHVLGGRLHNLPTDLDVDKGGNIWFCDPQLPLRTPGPQVYPLLEHASVLQLRRKSRGEWELVRRTHSTTAPRAVLLSADERTLFVSEHNETPQARRELRVYPLCMDRPNDFAVLCTFGYDSRGAHPGVAAMCLTADGDIVACVGDLTAGPGPMIQLISPTGLVLHSEPAPGVPTACAFAEEGLGVLYVASDDGALFRVADSGLRGFARASGFVGANRGGAPGR